MATGRRGRDSCTVRDPSVSWQGDERGEPHKSLEKVGAKSVLPSDFHRRPSVCVACRTQIKLRFTVRNYARLRGKTGAVLLWTSADKGKANELESNN